MCTFCRCDQLFAHSKVERAASLRASSKEVPTSVDKLTELAYPNVHWVYQHVHHVCVDLLGFGHVLGYYVLCVGTRLTTMSFGFRLCFLHLPSAGLIDVLVPGFGWAGSVFPVCHVRYHEYENMATHMPLTCIGPHSISITSHL